MEFLFVVLLALVIAHPGLVISVGIALAFLGAFVDQLRGPLFFLLFTFLTALAAAVLVVLH